MLTKQDSTCATSCHQVESCIINHPIDKVWGCLKSFDFDKLFPSQVSAVKWTNGSAAEIGSTFEVTYHTKAVWTWRIVELSELRHVLAYELISTQPEIPFSSMLCVIRLLKVTSEGTTYVQWETDFPSDVNALVIQDTKYKKLDYFSDLKKL
jgi:hypothetical protein